MVVGNIHLLTMEILGQMLLYENSINSVDTGLGTKIVLRTAANAKAARLQPTSKALASVLLSVGHCGTCA